MNNSYLTRIAFSLLFIIGFGFKSNAQYYTIPDSYFAWWIQFYHPACIINSNQLDINSPELAAIDSVDLYGSAAVNLDGIQYFTGLISLRYNNYNVTTIPSLPPNLRELQLNNTQIVNWPILPQSLREFRCDDNNLTALPVLPDSLTWLDCMGNQLTSLPPLPSSLLHLYCSGNQIGVLPVLPAHLKELAVYNCGLTSISSLPAELTYLLCDENQITSLPTVLPPDLEYLSINYNLITTLPNLPSGLVNLECSVNLLTVLPDFPATLRTFDAYGNQLTELPDLPQSLISLQCPNNLITSLPELPDSLWSLAVSHNLLTTLPHLPSTLAFFRCDTNQIHCFENLPENTQQLYTWYISGNPFTCVPTHRSYTGNTPVCTNSVWNNPYDCFSNYTHGIKGTVYVDQNTNCNADLSDQAVENVRINLLDNSGNFVSLVYTDNFGGYYFEVPNGTYHIIVDTVGAAYSSNCTIENSVTVSSNLIDSVDFVIACANNDDLSVSGIAPTGIVFPGQTHGLLVFASNQFGNFPVSCLDSLSGELTVSITGPVTYAGIPPLGFPQPAQVNGNTITFSVNNFSSMNWEDPFLMNLLVDQTAQSGDSVCVSVTLVSATETGNLLNNQMDLCYAVGNSYDPNIKEVFPTVVPPNYNDYLTYTIHFQNTGTAPAINIKLTDLIDPLLDPSTFELIHASDPVESKIQHDSLSFQFNNIWLADSTSNEPESHGFVQYRIKPFVPLSNGSAIENKASIYFDFNSPIVTNTAVTAVGNLSVNKSSKNNPVIYPNPSNGIFHIQFPESVEEVYVYTISGLQVAHETNPNANWSLDLSSQPKGVYILKRNNGDQSGYSKLMKL
nr:T9SS type A sorting domain-containing protein [uncultured Fluviicola sp.]